MNKKRIAEHLRKKHNDWLSSITDENVRERARTHSIITGGCFISLLTNERVSDYDIYFTDKETVLAVAKYYVDKYNAELNSDSNRYGYKHRVLLIDGAKDITEQITVQNEWVWKTKMLENITADRVKIVVRSDGVTKDTDEEALRDVEELLDDLDNTSADEKKEKGSDLYHIRFMSSNAITLSDRVQLIIRFYGSAAEIHSNFDYVHCTNYWESWSGAVSLNADALEAILNKRLVYVGSKYPLCSVVRMRKFIKRGWNISAGQILKICMQLSHLDLNDIAVLEDQLIGVDTMYFMDLIDHLSQKGNRVDDDYLVSLIDKIFA